MRRKCLRRPESDSQIAASRGSNQRLAATDEHSSLCRMPDPTSEDLTDGNRQKAVTVQHRLSKCQQPFSTISWSMLLKSSYIIRNKTWLGKPLYDGYIDLQSNGQSPKRSDVCTYYSLNVAMQFRRHVRRGQGERRYCITANEIKSV